MCAITMLQQLTVELTLIILIQLVEQYTTVDK